MHAREDGEWNRELNKERNGTVRVRVRVRVWVRISRECLKFLACLFLPGGSEGGQGRVGSFGFRFTFGFRVQNDSGSVRVPRSTGDGVLNGSGSGAGSGSVFKRVFLFLWGKGSWRVQVRVPCLTKGSSGSGSGSFFLDSRGRVRVRLRVCWFFLRAGGKKVWARIRVRVRLSFESGRDIYWLAGKELNASYHDGDTYKIMGFLKSGGGLGSGLLVVFS